MISKSIHFLIFPLLRIACGVSGQPSLGSNSTIAEQITSTAMNSVQIKQVTLQAREESRPPAGERPSPNREIGFASVFLKLENLRAVAVDVVIQSVVIQAVEVEISEAFLSKVQVVHLHPLENVEQALHFTNKTGFASKGKIRAIVAYSVEGEQYQIVSEPFSVTRF